ncbi:MAG: TetR/AcrR family transcriptional regulator [Burkholderiales bacterium]
MNFVGDASPMASAPAHRAGKTTAPRLTREDWLNAAFRAAIEGGFGAVKVLLLADTLGVTRGSFYWHFADHAELVRALIDRWYARELALDERLASPASTDAATSILAILDNAIAYSSQNRDNDRFEQALRSLASKDHSVAQLLENVDRERLRTLRTHYLRLTGDAATARDLSALLYLAVVGSNEALNRPSADAKMAEHLKSIIARHLVQSFKTKA